MLLFVAPRSEWQMLDDWGDLLGLKGVGLAQHRSSTAARSRRTGRWRTRSWSTSTSSDGTPGSRLHGNPMYGGRAMGPFTLSLGRR